jgi:hypothetical protein
MLPDTLIFTSTCHKHSRIRQLLLQVIPAFTSTNALPVDATAQPSVSCEAAASEGDSTPPLSPLPPPALYKRASQDEVRRCVADVVIFMMIFISFYNLNHINTVHLSHRNNVQIHPCNCITQARIVINVVVFAEFQAVVIGTSVASHSDAEAALSQPSLPKGLLSSRVSLVEEFASKENVNHIILFDCASAPPTARSLHRQGHERQYRPPAHGRGLRNGLLDFHQDNGGGAEGHRGQNSARNGDSSHRARAAVQA